MKKVLLLSSIILLFSCQNEKKAANHQLIVRNYYSELNNSNLKNALSYVSDSIVISEGDYIQVNSKEDWPRQFKWDSVFSPNYEIIEMKLVEGKIEATISKECRRISYLHDSPSVYKVSIEFKDGKISKEDIFDYLVFDFEKWQIRRDTLVTWIDKNHPNLSGFVYDQTVKGGQNYLKAIELYEKRNIK